MPLADTRVRASGKMPSPSSTLAEDRFHHLPHVVSARGAGATVLMDRKRGTYFTLNEVGARIWELIGAELSLPVMIERLLEEYDVPREQVENDVTTTIQQLRRDRLIAGGSISALAPTAQRALTPLSQVLAKTGELKVPSVFRCGLIILAVKVMLKTRGFAETIDWVRRRVWAVAVRDDVRVETIKAIEYQVAMAGALYPGRAQCLEQSLTLYLLLRRSGCAVKYCQGVQAHPFEGHAWVEYHGQPINDVEEHVKLFVRVADQLP